MDLHLHLRVLGPSRCVSARPGAPRHREARSPLPPAPEGAVRWARSAVTDVALPRTPEPASRPALTPCSLAPGRVEGCQARASSSLEVLPPLQRLRAAASTPSPSPRRAPALTTCSVLAVSTASTACSAIHSCPGFPGSAFAVALACTVAPGLQGFALTHTTSRLPAPAPNRGPKRTPRAVARGRVDRRRQRLVSLPPGLAPSWASLVGPITPEGARVPSRIPNCERAPRQSPEEQCRADEKDTIHHPRGPQGVVCPLCDATMKP